MIPPKVADRIAAKLDASPKVIANWRDAWRFKSIWANAGVFVMALGNGITFAAGAVPFWTMLPHLIVSAVITVLAIVGTIMRLRVQANLRQDDDDNDEHA